MVLVQFLPWEKISRVVELYGREIMRMNLDRSSINKSTIPITKTIWIEVTINIFPFKISTHTHPNSSILITPLPKTTYLINLPVLHFPLPGPFIFSLAVSNWILKSRYNFFNISPASHRSTTLFASSVRFLADSLSRAASFAAVRRLDESRVSRTQEFRLWRQWMRVCAWRAFWKQVLREGGDVLALVYEYVRGRICGGH
jgi:hypothetical protein